jgi:MFS family permease
MAMLARSSRPSAFAVFRRRNFTLLWIAQFISTMGSGLTSIAAAILVYRLTGSALSVGLMLMATALPSLFVGLIAGVFVDRGDREPRRCDDRHCTHLMTMHHIVGDREGRPNDAMIAIARI